MENQWITEKMTELKRLHSECGAEEIALSRYIGCMIRMLNGLAQMEYSQFHFYEKLMLRDSFEIFTEHFITQIDVARNEMNTERKRELVDDIENAVDRVSGVYKNVIDSTANSDRQMLSSLSIDTSIYELSPKICAFYSQILNKLVKTFQEKDAKYAFMLHPTLKNITEAKVMFEQLRESGKVVIIYISESIIEMFDVISITILHESFHVLTKKERMRKKRMQSFVRLMLAGMKQVLFDGVVFYKEEEEDEQIKNELLERFFSDCQKELDMWEKKPDENRDFYSGEIKKWGIEYFSKRLRKINTSLETWIREAISEKSPDTNFSAFQSNYEKENRIIEKIQENLFDAMYENKVSSLAGQFLFIFREIYADIACILTLQLNPEDYKNAFEKSKQFRTDGAYYDSTRIVRNYIVAISVRNYMPADIGSSWKEYGEELWSEFSEEERLFFENNSTFSQKCVMLSITPQMTNALSGYAQGCAKAFSDRINSNGDIQLFREYMKQIRNYDTKELWKNIMLGDFNEIFRLVD
ncbi:MAG: hypothetical protein NC341_02580 [Blautia sp.]|nr:hypothetical protein [Blautia sp.]MCM1200503.1 hypothetical protein [Bacteroides fragilis]